MAIVERELNQSKVLTYEDYLIEGETPGRYEIIDGVRYWMTSPLDEHQDIAQNIYDIFRHYQKSTRLARAYMAAIDIMIQRSPLRMRQPDVLLISKQRYDQYRSIDKPGWEIGPELVVEVISPSNSKTLIASKMAEYSSINSLECWAASPENRTIEQWQLSTNNQPKLIGTLVDNQLLHSVTFPELGVDVSSVFEL